MARKTKKSRLQQYVTLTFSDGTNATFNGPAVVRPGDPRRIVDVVFTEPKELPEGEYYEIENVPGSSPLLDP